MKNIYKNIFGFSSTELFVSVAILGGAGLVVTKLMQTATQTTVKIQTSVSLSTYASQILNYSKDKYLNVEDTSSEDKLHTKGLCELVSSNLSSGVGLIELNLFDSRKSESDLSSSPTFSDSEWNKIPNWELVNSIPEEDIFDSHPCIVEKNFVESNYFKCFKYKDSEGILGSDNVGETTPEKHKDLMYGVVEVIPMNLNPINDSGAKLFDIIDLTLNKNLKDDVKDIGFRIRSVVALRTYNPENNDNDPIIKINSKESFFWAGNIDYCHSNGAKLSMTGTIPGTGDPDLVVNTGSFNLVNDRPPVVNVEYSRSQVQTGFLYEVNGQKFIKSDVEQNVAVSCNEKWFRCPSESSSQREYDDLFVQTNFEFNRESKSLNGNLNPRFRPVAQIKNGEKDYNVSNGDLDTVVELTMGHVIETENSVIQEYILVSEQEGKEDEYYKKIYDLNEKVFKEEPFLEFPMRIGGEASARSGIYNLVFNIKDKGSINSANNLCRKVCLPSTQYNSKEGNQLFKFILGYHLIDESGKSFFNEQMDIESPEINCTSCYTKACDRFGLKTFGPMENLPAEPLDSQFPECSLKATSSINLDTFQSTTNSISGDLNVHKCVSGKINDSGQLEYFSRPCTDQLPILCYVFGEYRLYKDFGVDTTFSINSYSQYEADKKCLLMGLEFSRKENLEDMFDTQEVSNKAELAQGLMDPVKKSPSISLVNSSDGNSYYKYVNLAKRGIFIAPENYSQKGQLESFFHNSDNLESAYKEFWVGIEGDHFGFPLPHYEYLNDTINSNAQRFAIHFNGGGLIQARDINYDIYSAFKNPSSMRQGALLFHSIQHRGILFTEENRPSKVGVSNHVPDLTKRKAFLCAKAENDPNGKLTLSYFRSDKPSFNGEARGFDSNNNWFKSSDNRSEDINDGNIQCNNAGGVFIPPITPMSLLKSYSLVQPIHYRHTFPAHKIGGISEGFKFIDIFDNPADVSQILDPLWVALVKENDKVFIQGTDKYVQRPSQIEIPSIASSTFMEGLWNSSVKLQSEPADELKSNLDMYGSLYLYRIDPSKNDGSKAWFRRKAFCINDGLNAKPLVVDKFGNIVYKKYGLYVKGSDCEDDIAPTHLACFKDMGNFNYSFSFKEYIDQSTTCDEGMVKLTKSFFTSDFSTSDSDLAHRHYAGNFKKFIQIKIALSKMGIDQRIVIENN